MSKIFSKSSISHLKLINIFKSQLGIDKSHTFALDNERFRLRLQVDHIEIHL